MWFEWEIEDEIAKLRAEQKSCEKNYDDYDPLFGDDPRPEDQRWIEIQSEIDALERVLNSPHKKPTKSLTLEEVLQPLREQGFFCQLVGEPRRNLKTSILTISMDGVAGHSYRFSVEEFMHSLMASLDDFTPIEHMRLELNIGLMPTKANLPEEEDKKE